MKKYITIILTILLICIFTACGQSEAQDEPVTNNTTASTTPAVEEETEVSEKDQLQELLDVIAPITDYSLLRRVNDFYSIAVPAVLSSDPNQATEDLEDIQNEINLLLDAVIEATVPQGYGLQDNWEGLAGSCISLKNNLKNTLEALKDNDSSRVMELRESAGNTGIVENTVPIQNVLSEKISELQNNEAKQNIEVICSYEECMEKAAKYARYYFENPNITGEDLMGDSEPVIVDDIPGKHYAFYFDNIIIFINVEDTSIVCRESIANGYRDNYVNDGALPAEGDDLAMPDIIGMDWEEAKALLESMGIAYEEGGGIVSDTVPAGTVAHCYPSAGNAVTEDTTVVILKAIEVSN